MTEWIDWLGIDPILFKFLLFGAFTGIVITLDGYARGSIITPKNEDGKILKGRTISLYLSIIMFSSLAAITMGTIALELELGERLSFILAGLGGIVGRDLIYVLSERLLKKVEEDTRNNVEISLDNGGEK